MPLLAVPFVQWLAMSVIRVCILILVRLSHTLHIPCEKKCLLPRDPKDRQSPISHPSQQASPVGTRRSINYIVVVIQNKIALDTVSATVQKKCLVACSCV